MDDSGSQGRMYRNISAEKRIRKVVEREYNQSPLQSQRMKRNLKITFQILIAIANTSIEVQPFSYAGTVRYASGGHEVCIPEEVHCADKI